MYRGQRTTLRTRFFLTTEVPENHLAEFSGLFFRQGLMETWGSSIRVA